MRSYEKMTSGGLFQGKQICLFFESVGLIRIHMLGDFANVCHQFPIKRINNNNQ